MINSALTWLKALCRWLRMDKAKEERARERRIIRNCFEQHPKALEILQKRYGFTANEIAATLGEQQTGFKLGQQSIIEDLNLTMGEPSE